MDGEINIRPARPDDAAAMAAWHEEAFHGLLSARLGRKYLEYHYSGLISSPAGACFVAERAGAMCGFIGGSCAPRAGAAVSVRRLFSLAAALFSGRIGIRELPALLRYKRWFSRVKLPAELESLLVARQSRGRGTGKKLMEALDGFFRARGVTRYCVFNNTSLNTVKFYLRLGFKQTGEYDHGGHRTVCLIK